MRGVPAVKIGPNDFGTRFYSPLLLDLPPPSAGPKVPCNGVISIA